MTGINPQIVFAVSRVRAVFRDGVGNAVTIMGTGFFLRSEAGTAIFVTNRHNLDPSLKLNTDYSLASVGILLRRHDGTNFVADTQFFEVDLGASRLLHAPDADVSAIVAPVFINQSQNFLYFTINRQRNVADQAFLESKVFLMDLVSFFGYPGTSNTQWWDTNWNAAIARSASLASWPNLTFTNPGIPTADVTLVSGLSFSGSSGSLVMLHEKGIRPGGDIVDPTYAPPTLLGIMSGHWREPGDEPEMFRHSGLSYFTRSTAILDLLQAVP